MGEYSQLIKRFDKIRDYMRDFYVYGFKSREDLKSREDFSSKSLRSYDNEKRRIESYLGDLMAFRQDENGKNIFISIDSASITKNPLYRAFKAKTFTKNDITLNFFILDILTTNKALSVGEIADVIADEYLCLFEDPAVLDISTVRNKLKEYEAIGILSSQKDGKKLKYSLCMDNIDVNSISDAVAFFSEVSPVGVVGSFILDKCDNMQNQDYLTFKHHYILHALDSEIIEKILEAIHAKKKIEIVNFSRRARREVKIIVTPLKFLVSVQGGRQYISAFTHYISAFTNYRVDYIKSVTILDESPNFDGYYKRFEEVLSHTWGISFDNANHIEKVTMTLRIAPSEQYIINRIHREGRGGILTKTDTDTYCYKIEVYDAREMMTFIRTFIGRIISFECTNKKVQDIFYNDLNIMYGMYNIEGDVEANSNDI